MTAYVENNMLLNDIKGILPRVEVTMAQALHNGGVKITLQLNQRQEEKKHLLTPKEFLTKLEEAHPTFASLTKELKLEIE
jgi:hypothetical protein